MLLKPLLKFKSNCICKASSGGGGEITTGIGTIKTDSVFPEKPNFMNPPPLPLDFFLQQENSPLRSPQPVLDLNSPFSIFISVFLLSNVLQISTKFLFSFLFQQDNLLEIFNKKQLSLQEFVLVERNQFKEKSLTLFQLGILLEKHNLSLIQYPVKPNPIQPLPVQPVPRPYPSQPVPVRPNNPNFPPQAKRISRKKLDAETPHRNLSKTQREEVKQLKKKNIHANSRAQKEAGKYLHKYWTEAKEQDETLKYPGIYIHFFKGVNTVDTFYLGVCRGTSDEICRPLMCRIGEELGKLVSDVTNLLKTISARKPLEVYIPPDTINEITSNHQIDLANVRDEKIGIHKKNHRYKRPYFALNSHNELMLMSYHALIGCRMVWNSLYLHKVETLMFKSNIPRATLLEMEQALIEEWFFSGTITGKTLSEISGRFVSGNAIMLNKPDDKLNSGMMSLSQANQFAVNFKPVKRNLLNQLLLAPEIEISALKTMIPQVQLTNLVHRTGVASKNPLLRQIGYRN